NPPRVAARQRAALLVTAFVGAAAMLAIALRPRRATDRSSAYTGSEACRACHAGVADAWQSSLHHLAMLPAARRGGPVVARDGGLVMTGTALGVSEDVPLTYVLGRRHVEQYVGLLAPGRLQALPLAFDPVRGEWFDLFAGEGRRPEDFGHLPPTSPGTGSRTGSPATMESSAPRGALPETSAGQ